MKKQAGFYQEALVANPKNPKKQMRLQFLVDTGSTGTVIPKEVAEQLELECVGHGLVEVANGSRVPIRIAYLYMRLNGEHVFTLCSYNGCATPLLGFDVMHMLGLHIDTAKKQFLKPIRQSSHARALKSFVLKRSWQGSSSGVVKRAEGKKHG